MALRGHVFNKQLFTSECFALFIDTFLDKNCGVIKGCELSNTNDSVTINDGFFCIRGRFIQEVGSSTIIAELPQGNDIFCKLVCEIDLSKENTTSELKQVEYKILQSTEDYPSLQQEDITGEGYIYQFEFASFKCTTTGIQDFVDKRTYLDFSSIYTYIKDNIQNILSTTQAKVTETFEDITTKKDEFFSQLNITTKEEADQLIKDLKEYCENVKTQLEGDVAVNLLNKITAVEGNVSELDTKVKENELKAKTVTLLTTGWQQNEGTQNWEYTIEDNKIKEKEYVADGKMNMENREKLTDGDIITFDGGIKIITPEKPEEDITMDIYIQKVVVEEG